MVHGGDVRKDLKLGCVVAKPEPLRMVGRWFDHKSLASEGMKLREAKTRCWEDACHKYASEPYKRSLLQFDVQSIKAVKQNYAPSENVLNLLNDFRSMVNDCIRIGLKEKVTSLKSLFKGISTIIIL